MATVRPYLLKDRNRFQADTERNSYARFWQNSSSGFEGDVTSVKIKVGRLQPYLAMDHQNHIRADTTGPLGEQPGQVSKKSDQWSWRRCYNEKKFTDGGMHEWMPEGLSMG